MAEKPLCRKCEVPHWRFVSCEDAPAKNALDDAKPKWRAPVIETVVDEVDWGHTDQPVWWKDNNDG